jgi:polyferredoxin/tetratricopeptide (TPR) repeat protein
MSHDETAPGRGSAAPRRAAIRKSKASKWRAIVLGAVHVLILAHIAQWWVMGRTVSPIEPSEAMHTLQRGAINAGFIFFTLAILATMIFGRFVCGWGCHVIALQDACAWMLKKIGITPKPFRSRLLIYVPLCAALYMFVWPTFYRLFIEVNPEPIHFTNHLVTDDFWATFPSVAVAIPFLFICGFVTVYFLGMKGFCVYACPYGGFFRLADKAAPMRIRVTDACEQCGHCTAVCTSNVLVHAEVKQHRMVVDPNCMKCMDCVSVCPKEALYFGWGKLPIGRDAQAPVQRHYSITWAEEIAGALVFVGSLFAVRNVYGLVPFLMALGCAAVTTFLALKTWRLVAGRDVYFHKWNLKRAGKLQRGGWGFLAVAVPLLVLVVHSGWIRYAEFRGDRAFAQLRVPDELALAQPNPSRWISPADQENIRTGERFYSSAAALGLFSNPNAKAKHAWLQYLDGNAPRAVELLEAAAAGQRGEGKALSLYYRGAILNRLGQHEQAIASLDAALAEREDLILAHSERGEALWLLNRQEEAIATWRAALQRNPRLALTGNQLAGAYRALGRHQEAANAERHADAATPADALYHHMVALRLQNLGMHDLSQKHHAMAEQIGNRMR